jgi:hypothetical protein
MIKRVLTNKPNLSGGTQAPLVPKCSVPSCPLRRVKPKPGKRKPTYEAAAKSRPSPGHRAGNGDLPVGGLSASLSLQVSLSRSQWWLRVRRRGGRGGRERGGGGGGQEVQRRIRLREDAVHGRPKRRTRPLCGRECGAEGRLGRTGGWGGREYGAQGRLRRKGAWGADGSGAQGTPWAHPDTPTSTLTLLKAATPAGGP